MASRKVGFFHNGNEESFSKQFEAFSNRLHQSFAKTDIDVVPRWAGNDPARTEQHLNELVAQGVAVLIAAGGPPSALAAQKATAANPIPVVFTSVADPVGLGLVGAPGKPPTNLTGVAGLTSELDVARLELLHELLGDGAGRIGVLTNPARPQVNEQFKQLDAAALRLKLTLVRQNAANLGEIEAAFTAFKSGQKIDGLLVTADSLFNNLREKVVKFADGRPAIYQWREFAEVGGYMSFGPNIIDAYEQVADYAKLILDGKKPSELPVVLPSRFELLINIDVAFAGGFNIPASLLSRAEFVRTQRR